MIEQLTTLLAFDPLLIGAFAGLSMMVVQMLKGMFVWVDKHAMFLNMMLSLFFAVMIVLEFTSILAVAILAFLIMSSASGVYSASKAKKVVDLPDYGDES